MSTNLVNSRPFRPAQGKALFTLAQNEFFDAAASSGITVALTGQSYATSAGMLAPSTAATLTGQSSAYSQGTLTASVGGGPVSVALTGQSISYAQGSLAAAVDKALTGQAATYSQGTLSPVLSAALAGLSTAHTQGALAAAIDKALGGQSAAYSQGTITFQPAGDVTVALSGVAITYVQGTLAAAVQTSLAGQAYTTQQGALTPALSSALTGQASTYTQGSLAPSASVALTGQQATYSQGAVTAVTGGDIVVALTGLQIGYQQGALGVQNDTPASGGGHGFEMGGQSAQQKRRNLVYVLPDEARSSAKPAKTKEHAAAEFSKAREAAAEIIKSAALEHAEQGVSKAVRYGHVRTSLKPLAESLGDWNWINLYQRIYDAAIIDQLRKEIAVADQIEEDGAIAFLLLNM